MSNGEKRLLTLFVLFSIACGNSNKTKISHNLSKSTSVPIATPPLNEEVGQTPDFVQRKTPQIPDVQPKLSVTFYAYKDTSGLQNELSSLKKEVFLGNEIDLPNAPSKTNAQAGFKTNSNGLEARFISWKKNDDDSEHNPTQKITVNKNLKFYAHWREIEGKIILRQTKSANKIIKEFTLTVGESLIEPINPSPPANKELSSYTSQGTDVDDYKAYFEGWYYDDNAQQSTLLNFTSLPQDLPADLTLYGKWSATKYKPKLGIAARPGQLVADSNRGPTAPKVFNDLYDPESVFGILYTQYGRSKSSVKAKEIDVSEVTDMSYLFFMDMNNLMPTRSFDGEVEGWDVSSVENMSYMFFSNDEFKQPIGNWNVSKVNNMAGLFQNTWKFDQSIQNWDVTQVVNMEKMFSGSEFNNSSIENWNIGKVNNMKEMFAGAMKFDQDMSQWKWKPACSIKLADVYQFGYYSPLNLNLGVKLPQFYKNLTATSPIALVPGQTCTSP